MRSLPIAFKGTLTSISFRQVGPKDNKESMARLVVVVNDVVRGDWRNSFDDDGQAIDDLRSGIAKSIVMEPSKQDLTLSFYRDGGSVSFNAVHIGTRLHAYESHDDERMVSIYLTFSSSYKSIPDNLRLGDADVSTESRQQSLPGIECEAANLPELGGCRAKQVAT